MYTKTQFLEEVSTAGKLDLVSQAELILAFNRKKEVSIIGTAKPHNLGFSRALSFLGGMIVLLGILFLVGIYWSVIGDLGQVLVTLGSGITTFIMGSLLIYSLDKKFVGNAFHLIAGFMIPGGIFVWLSKFGPSSVNTSLVVATVFGVLAILYLIFDYFLLKSNLITLFIIGYLSTTYWALFVFLMEKTDFLFYSNYRITAWAGLIFSLCFIYLDQLLKITSKKSIAPLICTVGFLGLFGSIFSLIVEILWAEILYGFLLFGGIYLSVKIKSSLILTATILYILFYIFYITGRYFVNVVGWPVALIFAGLLMIGLSYFAVDVNKKFIKKP